MWPTRLSRLQHMAFPGLGRVARQHTLCVGCMHSLKLDHRLSRPGCRQRQAARTVAQAAVATPELEKADFVAGLVNKVRPEYA